ncbi:hypothetical protein IC615_23435 [Serratia ureilytica]
MAPELLNGVSVIFADGVSLVVEPMRFQAPMAQLAADYAPDCRLSPVDDYLYWACIGSAERLGGAPGLEENTALQARVRHISQGWAPALQTALALADPCRSACGRCRLRRRCRNGTANASPFSATPCTP